MTSKELKLYEFEQRPCKKKDTKKCKLVKKAQKHNETLYMVEKNINKMIVKLLLIVCTVGDI